jgi:hypothetical protein
MTKRDGNDKGEGRADGAVPDKGINTLLAHAGNDPHAYHGFVSPPVVHASTVLFPDAATMASRKQQYTYGTRGTPTTDALAGAIDALEGSAGTVLVPSGLAAVTLPLLAFLSAGDHVLIVDSVYNPTRRFADTMLARLGVSVEYYPPEIGGDIARLLRPETKVVFTESPGSNTFEVQDIPAIASAARGHGAIVMMDNTWATPIHFRPLEHGVDISIHAATKYPAGHSDVLLGTVSANERCWDRLHDAFITMGVCAGPFAWRATSRARSRSRAGWKARQAWRAFCIRRSRASRPIRFGSAISGARAAYSRSCSTGGASARPMPFSTRSKSSASAIPGAGSRASRSMSGWATARCRAATMAALSSGCRSGWRTSTI